MRSLNDPGMNEAIGIMGELEIEKETQHSSIPLFHGSNKN